jgi:hypothetical protein
MELAIYRWFYVDLIDLHKSHDGDYSVTAGGSVMTVLNMALF